MKEWISDNITEAIAGVCIFFKYIYWQLNTTLSYALRCDSRLYLKDVKPSTLTKKNRLYARKKSIFVLTGKNK